MRVLNKFDQSVVLASLPDVLSQLQHLPDLMPQLQLPPPFLRLPTQPLQLLPQLLLKLLTYNWKIVESPFAPVDLLRAQQPAEFGGFELCAFDCGVESVVMTGRAASEGGRQVGGRGSFGEETALAGEGAHDVLFQILWCRQQSLQPSLSLLMQVKPLLPHFEQNSDSPPPSASPTVRFSFLAKILSASQPKPIYDPLLRPARFARTSGGEDVSVKSMLKKSIISEAGSQCAGDRGKESFLMKGRTLAGTQKPIENHLNSFLLGIHQRINKEIDSVARPESLPPLHEDWDRGRVENEADLQGEKQHLSQSRLEEKQRQGYNEVYRNLKDLRSSCPDPPESPALPKSKIFLKYRQRSEVAGKRGSQTISYHSDQPPAKPEPPLLPLPLIPRESTFRKGYLSYDETGKRFLQSCKSTMQLECTPSPIGRDISARCFIVAHCGQLRAVAGRRADEQVEIASLSKIMTCYLTIMVCRKYGIDPHLHPVRVGDRAPETPGTTAELQTGDVLTVYDLLMGLMLPSGNDASVVLAEAMGKLIQRHKKRETRKTHYQTFIAHMNLLSKELGLSQVWGNSSGLPACPNLSSPADMIVLTSVALKSPLFHRIVNTRTHQIDLRNERYGLSRRVLWRNTNRLLESGWEGVKTGTTDTAGHCLMAKRGDLLVCVLDCDTLARRFTECQKLYERFAQS